MPDIVTYYKADKFLVVQHRRRFWVAYAIGQNLKPSTGNGDDPVRVKKSRVGRKSRNKQTRTLFTFVNIFSPKPHSGIQAI